MNIEVLNYSPGPFSALPDLWEKIDDKKDISMEVISRIRYTQQKDIVGYQFDIRLIYENDLVIKTGFLFGLKIRNLEKYIGDSLSKEHNTRSIAEITEYVWPLVIGAFAARCADHKIQMILPRINYNRFAEEVMLIKSESSE